MPDSMVRRVFVPERAGDRTLALIICLAVSASMAVRFGLSARLPVAIALSVVLVYLAVFDARTRRLPDRVVFPLAGSGLLLAVVSQFVDTPLVPLIPLHPSASSSPLLTALVGALVGAFVPLGIDLIYGLIRKKSGLGAGDVKLLGAIGLFIGPSVIWVLFLGSLAGVFWGLALLVARKGADGKFPFGPFLVGATIFLLLGGTWILGG